MSKYLVIIEAPGKVKKIQSFLGNDYEVIATKGHFRDLPEKKLGISIKNNFEPTYEVIDKEKQSIVNNIIQKSKKSKEVYILTDSDREGEYIGYHVSLILDKVKCKRLKTNSITKEAISKCLQNPGELNFDLIAAAEARRILDRLVGYKCSFPVQQATGGKSAGRTQSAGLRLLAEREKEIQDFKPIIYWPVEVELLTSNKEKILATIKKPKPLDISTEEEANDIIGTLKSNVVKTSKYEVKKVLTKAYAPFTTSTLQQSASSILGFSPKRTMFAAQNLYQAGACTYHRTDCVNIVPEFINNIRSHITSNFTTDYLPASANAYVNKSKNAQEAHEAIRPTDIAQLTWAGSGADESKLYQLIWKRTVSSQMLPAEYERRSAEFVCKDIVLSANGNKEIFDGFKKVWDYSETQDNYLPDLNEGDIVDVIDCKTEKKETKPPARYSEASFIKELENRGIGRPATYASIPSTLLDRKYIEINKSKSIVVTILGMSVSDFMVDVNFCFIDLNFTGEMEERLDEISKGKAQKNQLLEEYWERLKSDIENAKQKKKQQSLTDFECPKCNSKLSKKHSQWGAFLGCSNYPECKYIAKIGEDGNPIEKKEVKKEYYSKDCPKCNSKMVKRQSKYGEFWGCEKYPKCKTIFDLDGNLVEKTEKKYKSKKKKK